MRYLILFMLGAGICVFGVNTCGNGWNLGFGGVSGEGPVKTESRNVGDFHAINAQISADIEVRISEQYSVEVEAQENLLSIIKTEVKNGTLRIYSKESIWSSDGLVIRVAAPAFDGLALAGSGNIRVKSPLNGETLQLSIAGSGDIDLPEANVNKLTCEIAGSGDIAAGGRATEAYFNIAGSGDIHADRLQAERGEAGIAGSGTINCQVTQRLKASISGSGDVYYTGSPQVDTHVSGSGSVTHKNEQ